MSSFLGRGLPADVDVRESPLEDLEDAIREVSCEEKAREDEEDISLLVDFFCFGTPYRCPSLWERCDILLVSECTENGYGKNGVDSRPLLKLQPYPQELGSLRNCGVAKSTLYHGSGVGEPEIEHTILTGEILRCFSTLSSISREKDLSWEDSSKLHVTSHSIDYDTIKHTFEKMPAPRQVFVAVIGKSSHIYTAKLSHHTKHNPQAPAA